MFVSDPVKTLTPDWASLFSAYRVAVIRRDEVVQGRLHPELDIHHPRVRAALDLWGGTHFSDQGASGTTLTLVRPTEPPKRERWWLHVLLGLLTLLTATLAGAIFVGYDPVAYVVYPLGPLSVPIPIRLHLPDLVPGLAFSVPLLGILFAHEMGHYLAGRWHRMDVSPPYFIPAPHWINLIGTFGAFIRLRSVMVNRAMLLDVGAGGPVVSFLLSIPAFWLGLSWSVAIPELAGGAPAMLFVQFQGQAIWLGDSLLTGWIGSVVSAGEPVVYRLHPLAFAGWLGLFVTALNLFPLSQLDGGHILYALARRMQHAAGLVFLLALFVLGNPWWGGWSGWWLWGLLILVLGRGSIRHPPVFDPGYPIGAFRRGLGWFCVLVLVLTFVREPIFV